MKDQIIEWISLAFCKAIPLTNLGNKDISAEKKIEAAVILIKTITIKSQICEGSSINKSNKVIHNSISKSENKRFLILNLSIITPEKGAITTAGKRCITVTIEITKAEEEKSTNIVYIATEENQAPKYAINCKIDSFLIKGYCFNKLR